MCYIIIIIILWAGVQPTLDPAKSITSADVSATDTLTPLIKVPATVKFYRGHRRTLCCLPGIISLIVVCVAIIFT